MDFPRQTFRALAALTAAAALSACGGGGGDGTNAGGANDVTSFPAAGGATAAPGASGGTNSPAAGGTTGAGAGGGTNPPAGGSPAPGMEVIPSAGTLQTSTLPTSYVNGSLGGNALASLNSARQAAGAGLLNQSTQLDIAAAAHTTYLTTNIGAVGHSEEATKINFFEVSPPSRIAKAGFAASYSTEAISAGSTLLSSDCVQQLLNTVYQAVALLSPATHVGFGFGANFATTPICVSDLATLSSDTYGQVAGANSLLTYPYGDQTGVFEAFDVDVDSPRPSLAMFPNATAGTPVIVNVRNADYVNFLAAGTLNVTVTKFELKDRSGNMVPAEILANPSLQAGVGVALNADANLLTGAAVLVPLAPLLRAQTYTAAFSATLKVGTPALEKTWSFTTRP